MKNRNQNIEQDKQDQPRPEKASWQQYFLLAIMAVAVLLTFLGNNMRKHAGPAADILVNQGWHNEAALMVRNKIVALWHGAIMAFLVTGSLHLLRRRKGAMIWRVLVPWLLVLVVAIDAYRLSTHYIKPMPTSFYQENGVIRYLKENQGLQRVATIDPDLIFPSWETYLFPYHNIRAFGRNLGRLVPDNYTRLLEATERVPERLYQLSSVGYILAPTAVFRHWRNTAMPIGSAIDIDYTFDIMFTTEAGLATMVETPPAPQSTGEVAIARLTLEAPRYALFSGWKAASDEETLKYFSDPTIPLWKQVWLTPDDYNGLPVSTNSGLTGSIDVIEQSPGYAHLRVDAPTQTMLRMAEAYNPYWQATIDDRPTSILRADFMFQALPIPAGNHNIILHFVPPRYSLVSFLTGLATCLIALAYILIKRHQHH
jgi:hypothetical protein